MDVPRWQNNYLSLTPLVSAAVEAFFCTCFNAVIWEVHLEKQGTRGSAESNNLVLVLLWKK